MAKKVSQLSGIKEIARRSNVSIGTVDRVINNRTGVAPKTRDKINAIIRELDYQPNLLARRLASRKIIHLATLIPSVSEDTSFWEAPLQGIARAEAEVRQYNVVIDKYFFDQNDKDSFVKQSQKLLRKKPDGVLLAPDFIDESVRFSDKCQRLGIPYVYIDSDIPKQKSLSYIGPNLYDSGYLAGHLVRYLSKGDDESVLVLNISREIDNKHHLFRKEEGFRGYFKDHNLSHKIEKINIRKTDAKSIEQKVDDILSKRKDIRFIFITNSKVSIVANHLSGRKKKYVVIGYDFTTENVHALRECKVDFLICQKPGDQAYRGLMILYKFLVQHSSVEETIFMPIDIITKENYLFYKN